MSVLQSLSAQMLPAVEAELRQSIDCLQTPELAELHTMLAYHMGWTGERAGPEAAGKRIRPLIVLLCASAASGSSDDWGRALPAAAAVELVHNFSLIHDDIEDNSPLRRGRPTVWKIWGIPQAVNAGDSMLTLAHLAVLRLDPAIALQAARILQQTCLELTQGQFLDLSYETRGDLSLEAYWPMVGGKTAALLGASTELGALCGEAAAETRAAYRDFGASLGLAFQALDDLLGIWGDAGQTGKSADSDLVSGKKSLPVLYGLAQDGAFARRWQEGSITPGEVPDLAKQLEREGARGFTRDHANRLTDQALQALEQAAPRGEAGEALQELADMLLRREK